MLNSSVLVLNRSYLPIHVTSARRAFSLIYRQTARAVNEEYETFDFEQWQGCGRHRERRHSRSPRDRAAGLRSDPQAARSLQPRQRVRARQVHLPVLWQ
jgi:hypothetical protein